MEGSSWTGSITPKESGSYILGGDFVRGRLYIWVDGTQVLNRSLGVHQKERFADSKLFNLEAEQSHTLKVQYVRDRGRDSVELQWQRHISGSQGDEILDRVATDGTSLIVSGNNTATFAQELANRGIVKYTGAMDVDVWWKAGAIFALKHPLFKELPQNIGMNWEYQDLATYEVMKIAEGLYTKDGESKRYGLLREGEEVAAFCTDGHKHKVASTVSAVRDGKGKIVLSCLNLYPFLTDDSKSANSAKKVLCNYLEYANGK